MLPDKTTYKINMQMLLTLVTPHRNMLKSRVPLAFFSLPSLLPVGACAMALLALVLAALAVVQSRAGGPHLELKENLESCNLLLQVALCYINSF